MVAPLSSSHLVAEGSARCVRADAHVAHYCGRASARLSVFPGALFEGGFCARKRVTGVALLQVRIGAMLLDGSSTNGGLTYFSLGIADSRSKPTSGNVIAFFRSRRWFGRVVSMQGGAVGGTFVAQGIMGGHGSAHGRFRC
jgi:hypothetical protein